MDSLMSVLGFLAQIPWWGYVILVVVLLFIFGDRGLWDIEAKFPLTDGVGRGEVEFEGYKKRGHIIGAKFMLEPGFSFNEIEIFLNGVRVAVIPKGKRRGNRVFLSEKTELDQPNEGDVVSVAIDGNEVFSGPLVKD